MAIPLARPGASFVDFENQIFIEMGDILNHSVAGPLKAAEKHELADYIKRAETSEICRQVS